MQIYILFLINCQITHSIISYTQHAHSVKYKLIGSQTIFSINNNLFV